MLTLKDSLAIENNPKILDFRFEFDDILMWPFIRVILHKIPIYKEYKLVNFQNTSKEKLSFTDKILYLRNTIINNPYKNSLKKKYDILMFCSGITNVKRGNKYFNRVSDYFAFVNKDKTLLIEDSVRRKYYTPRVFPNVCYHDLIKVEVYIRSKFARLNERDVKKIESLMNFLKRNFPYKLEKSDLDIIENILLRTSKRLNIYHCLYNKLFEKFNPKVVFLEDASYGGRSYILKWAKARNIITIEPQHGMVSKNQAAYNYGTAILNSCVYKKYLPDYFLTYGKYWKKSINLPVKKITIGNPNYSENTKKISLDNQDKTKMKILIISDSANPDIMKKIVIEISSIVNNNKYDISFRPHPSELPIIENIYSELLVRDTIKIDTEKDVYLSLSNTDLVIGQISTALFEAIGICRYIFAIDQPITDLHVPQNIIKRFSNVKELINIIQTYNSEDNKVNKGYIWEPNWKANYQNFMNNLIGL